MNFNELQYIENYASSNNNELTAYQIEIIDDFLEKESKKSTSSERPFVYFYEDIINENLTYNFQQELGEKNFQIASNDALCCLNICDDFYKLSVWSVNAWLLSALKFIDTIILHYIQEKLKEVPKKYDGIGIEKSRYVQLSKKTGDISIAGEKLKELYDLRNSLEHRTITYKDGRQELIQPQRAKIRKTIAKQYPDILKRVQKTYKDFTNNNS